MRIGVVLEDREQRERVVHRTGDDGEGRVLGARGRERAVDVVADEHPLGQRHQEALDQQRAPRIVVDDERATLSPRPRRRAGPSCSITIGWVSSSWRADTGSVNTNFVPDGSDSTQIRPPCASMIVREIESPSAVPPTRRLDAENGSKIFSRSSAAIGSPELCTETPTASSDSGGPKTSTVIVPFGGANRIAFVTKLPSTCDEPFGIADDRMSSAVALSTIESCLFAAPGDTDRSPRARADRAAPARSRP